MSVLCPHSQHWYIMGLGLYYLLCSRSSWNIALLIPTRPHPVVLQDTGLGASSLAVPKTLSVALTLMLLCLNPTLLTSTVNISKDLLISGMNSELTLWTAARKKEAALV